VKIHKGDSLNRRADRQLLAALRRRRVGVLMGGWSEERAISLKSGAAVCRALRRLRIPFVPIDASHELAAQVRRARVHLAFLALHGPFGEDGRAQGLLDIMGIPYTGSGARASAVAMHKPSAKKVFSSERIPTPRWRLVRRGEIFRPPPGGPWVVKPAAQGSAVGVSIVRRGQEWRAALRRAFRHDDEVVVEKFVAGTEVTVGILNDRALPAIEIVPRHAFYDFYSKYAKGGSRHIIPARLPRAVLEKISDAALKAYRAIGCRHFARVDLMVSRRGEPFVLEVNTLPGLTDTSLLPDAARAAGLSFDDLVLEILSLALRDASRWR
jgi:D-alanine-D-alanine ligase